MEKIDLTKQVVTKSGSIRIIKHILLVDKLGVEIEVSYDGFIEKYENYADPKDVEIATLKAIIAEMKNPTLGEPKRRRLLPDELKEIDGLIRKGIGNQPIAYL